MAKATSRIKTGKNEYIEVGGDVPDAIAKANPHLVSSDDFKPSYDPADQASLDGKQAALDSIRMRPDNPDRPASVEGESSWKVTAGGALGNATPAPIEERGKDAKKAADEARAKGAEAARAGGSQPDTKVVK